MWQLVGRRLGIVRNPPGRTPGLSRRLSALVVLVVVPALANAQTDVGAVPKEIPNVRPQPPPPPSQPTSPPPFAEVTAFGQALGKSLADKGVYLQLGYSYNLNSLALGGFKTGTVPNEELFFGSVLDLQKIAGIPEASFHVIFDSRAGFGLSQNVGSLATVENNVGPTRAVRLSQFFYEQGLYGDRIDIRVGRTNPTADFATSVIACQFVLGAICAQPNSWYANNDNNAYPSSSWGGFINVAATPTVYFRAGAYDDDPSQNLPNQHGFNWNVRGSTGVFVPMEVGYQTSFGNARYPAKYDVGGYVDDADYTSPAGIPLHGRSAVWLQGQQTVWRPDPATQQSLTVFGGGIWYNGGTPYWTQVYAGVFDQGPFASRPADTAGFIGSYYANSSSFRPTAANEWTFEINYGYQVATGLTLKPYTQYIVAPDNLGQFDGARRPDNAWIVGFQVAIDVGDFLGFPRFVAY